MLSAVIPTLNAAATLPAAIVSLRSGGLRDIVVADGGSTDETPRVATGAGARVVAAPRGRGTQLAVGALAAQGDWLLFLHADCRLEPGWAVKAGAFIGATAADRRAGYFDLALDDHIPAARRLERIVAWRCRVLALPYGDQGLLISRALYDAVGGFAPLPLMEDVDLIRRLGRARLARIGAVAVASARRYRQGGYWWRPALNLVCLSLYFAGVAPRHIARIYG